MNKRLKAPSTARFETVPLVESGSNYYIFMFRVSAWNSFGVYLASYWLSGVNDVDVQNETYGSPLHGAENAGREVPTGAHLKIYKGGTGGFRTGRIRFPMMLLLFPFFPQPPGSRLGPPDDGEGGAGC